MSQRSIQMISDYINNDFAEEVLKQVIFDSIKGSQERARVGLEDQISDLLDTFKRNATQHVLNQSKSWQIKNRDFFLFPRDCRFCFQRGDSTVFIIEQPPKCRMVSFFSSMFDEYDPNAAPTRRVYLSMPYTVFIVHFKNDVFKDLYCGFRKLPLSSMEDILGQPLLPNIHFSGKVCLGKQQLNGKTLSEITDEVIGHFWSSNFNDDLDQFWRHKGRIDARFASLATWMKNTETDSLFVLNVSYEPLCEGKSISVMVDNMVDLERDLDQHQLGVSISEHIDFLVENMSRKMLLYLQSKPFVASSESVKEKLTEKIQKSCDELMELLKNIQENQLNSDKPVRTMIPVSKFFKPQGL